VARYSDEHFKYPPKSYKTFQNSFSLESYFQRSSRTIIIELEASLKCDLKKHDHEKYGQDDSSQPRLHATYAVLVALRTCSRPDVLLPGLLHKFYRLQIQIIYRYGQVYSRWSSGVKLQWDF